MVVGVSRWVVSPKANWCLLLMPQQLKDWSGRRTHVLWDTLEENNGEFEDTLEENDGMTDIVVRASPPASCVEQDQVWYVSWRARRWRNVTCMRRVGHSMKRRPSAWRKVVVAAHSTAEVRCNGRGAVAGQHDQGVIPERWRHMRIGEMAERREERSASGR